MKTRYDKLIVVRDVASRIATASFAEAAAHLAGQEALAVRLDSAANALSPEIGAASGAALAAQLELAGRMQAARSVAQARIDDARRDCDETALTRKASRRALDAAVDIRRAHQQARVTRAETRQMPVTSTDQSR